MRMISMKRPGCAILSIILCGLAVAAWTERARLQRVVPRWARVMSDTTQSSIARNFDGLVRPGTLRRPYGMAPAVFKAYVRACTNAHVHPFRIGQTIGDHPRSAGYHLRDGVLKVDGERIEYTAAVDLGAEDLSDAQRNRLMEALAKQGFVSWWRSGPKWQGNEHIHAVYALIPMKPQLREQVLLWLRERRAAGEARPKWVRKIRESPQFRAYFS